MNYTNLLYTHHNARKEGIFRTIKSNKQKGKESEVKERKGKEKETARSH